MKTRIIVAAVGLPLLLVVLLALPPIATALLIAAMSVVAVYELLWATGLVKDIRLIGVSMLMALTVSLWCSGDMFWAEALIGLWVYVIALVCLMIASHAQLSFQNVCISVFAGLIVPLMLSALTRIRVMDYGRYYILIPLVLCFGTDSAAYFVGCAIGKHKMAPIISPKKSWEGAVGGALGGIVLMFLYTLILDLVFHMEVQYAACILYGVLGSVTCVIGDLAFSVIKRQTGIKDYGSLLPGHGGVLDRFDSMSFVAPLTEALLLLLPLIVA
ncbi:MAG: phosphatidate cytidylyltransferase [Oscillospiraceae bacterium]|nr:phosphatidate cytidylyltransferase [Oscillospiraceae bacterium]